MVWRVTTPLNDALRKCFESLLFIYCKRGAEVKTTKIKSDEEKVPLRHLFRTCR